MVVQRQINDLIIIYLVPLCASVVPANSASVDIVPEQRLAPNLSINTMLNRRCRVIPIVVKSSYRRISSNSLSSNWASVSGGRGAETDCRGAAAIRGPTPVVECRLARLLVRRERVGGNYNDCAISFGGKVKRSPIWLHFKFQKDGSWGYVPGARGGYGSMTAAGISSSFIVNEENYKDNAIDQNDVCVNFLYSSS